MGQVKDYAMQSLIIPCDTYKKPYYRTKYHNMKDPFLVAAKVATRVDILDTKNFQNWKGHMGHMEVYVQI